MKASHPLQNLSQRKNSYFIHLELGFIGALVLIVSLFRLDIDYKPDIIIEQTADVIDTIDLPDITVHVKVPPKPLVPIVPVVVPSSEIIDDEPINFESDNFEIGLPIEMPKKAIDEPVEFRVIEKMPEIVGGYSEVFKHLTYPKVAQEVGIQGKVILEFLVNERGQISDIKVIRGIGGGCDEAAIAAIKKVTFRPGLQRGRPVSVRFTLPVTFKLK